MFQINGCVHFRLHITICEALNFSLSPLSNMRSGQNGDNEILLFCSFQASFLQEADMSAC